MNVGQDPVRRRLSNGFQASLVWECALVGLAGGLLVTLYRLSLSWAERTLRWLLGLIGSNALAVAAWMLVLVALAAIVSLLVRWEPKTSGSGIPQVDAEVMGAMDAPWRRIVLAKFAEGTLAALGGLSLGREGPSVQLGGMAGKAVSRALRRGRGEERLLVTCGAGAGMAAAFHAPLTGVMFALEEIHKTFNAALIVSAMSAAVVSDYVSSDLLGIRPVLSFAIASTIPRDAYVLIVAFGLFMGVIGSAHNAGMFWAQDALSRVAWRSPFGRFVIPFLVAGPVALLAPSLLDGGDAVLELLSSPEALGLSALALLLAGKYAFTGICFGAGVPGGTLFPLVVMGGLSGALFGQLAVRFFGLDPSLVTNFTVLGIAGMFSGAIRAPVTAVVLAFELTGSLQALLSLSIVSLIAYVTANLLGVDPYYDHLLGKLLGMSTKEAHGRWGAEGKQLHSYVVEVGSRAAGSKVRDLPWPAQSLVVTVTRHGQEIVPRGSLSIEAGDRLLVLMNEADGDHSEETIRKLCHGTYALHNDRT